TACRPGRGGGRCEANQVPAVATLSGSGQWSMPMKWVTRERPKTDRIACPWLIRRFIDGAAQILYVSADRVLAFAADEAAHSFDAPGAEYTHCQNKCTFEVLIDDYGLGEDAALVRLARIVHAADIAGELGTDPLGPGLLAIGEGGLSAEPDDQRLLEKGGFVYDALYAWCQREVAPSPRQTTRR
ncbi:MAG TPA: chromate resistance protein ChrB domain-containing protein, partial [Candidatus Dormibacteraeota bacterium]